MLMKKVREAVPAEAERAMPAGKLRREPQPVVSMLPRPPPYVLYCCITEVNFISFFKKWVERSKYCSNRQEGDNELAEVLGILGGSRVESENSSC